MDPVDNELVQLLHDRSGGEPLLIKQMLEEMVARGDVQLRNGRWMLTGRRAHDIPTDVGGLVQERLRGLTDVTRPVIRQASVIGEVFSDSELYRVNQELPPSEQVSEGLINNALQQLQAVGLIVVARAQGDNARDSGTAYAFDHEAIREAVYAGLSDQARRELHAAVGRALAHIWQDPGHGAAEIARHFRHAGEREQELDFTLLAGDEAEGAAALHEAARLYRRAYRLAQQCEDPTSQAKAQAKLGRVLEDLGDYDEAIKAMEQAMLLYQGAGLTEPAKNVVAQAGYIDFLRGRADAGIERVKPMIEEAELGQPTPALASLYATLLWLYSAHGLFDDQLNAASRLITIVGQLRQDRMLPEDRADGFLALAEIRRGAAMMFLGNVDEGIRMLDEGVRIAIGSSDIYSALKAFSNLAWTYTAQGHFREAMDYVGKATSLAPRAHNSAWRAYIATDMAHTEFYTGDWKRAGPRLARARDTLGYLSSSWFAGYPSFELGRLCLGRRDPDQALRHLERAHDHVSKTGDVQGQRIVQRLIGEAELMRGKTDDAVAILGALEGGPNNEFSEWSSWEAALAEALVEAGQLERAGAVLKDAMTRAEERGLQVAQMDMLRISGRLASRSQDSELAVRLLQASADLGSEIGYKYGTARSLLELGVVTYEAEQRERGARDLREAKRIFTKLGSARYVEEIDRLLMR